MEHARDYSFTVAWALAIGYLELLLWVRQFLP